jgi:hypothetical protein
MADRSFSFAVLTSGRSILHPKTGPPRAVAAPDVAQEAGSQQDLASLAAIEPPDPQILASLVGRPVGRTEEL